MQDRLLVGVRYCLKRHRSSSFRVSLPLLVTNTKKILQKKVQFEPLARTAEASLFGGTFNITTAIAANDCG
eukprot:7889-Heterococcus_DN1.PRE.2